MTLLPAGSQVPLRSTISDQRYRGPVAIAAIWFGLVTGLAGIKAWAFFSGAFDLGVFVHAFRTVASGGVGAEIQLIGRSFLEDHFSPLVLPIAWIANSSLAPYLLIAIQASALAAASILVWRAALARGKVNPYIHQIGFLAAPIVLFAAWNDFHPSVLALPFLVLLFDGLERADNRAVLTGGILAALAREDIAFLVLLAIVIWWQWSYTTVIVFGVAGACLAAAFLLSGGESWFLLSGLAYLEGATVAVISILGEIWDGGLAILILLLIGLPWIFLGRMPWRPVVISLCFVTPLLALDFPMIEHVGNHYFVPVAAPLAVGVLTSESRKSDSRIVAIPATLVALFLGPLGTSLAGERDSPAWLVIYTALDEGGEIAATHSWASGLQLGDEVSAATLLVPWIDRPEVYHWPAPFADVTLGRISQTPIVRADPNAHVSDVLALNEGWTVYGPTGEEQNLVEFGYRQRSISPDGRFSWWTPGD